MPSFFDKLQDVLAQTTAIPPAQIQETIAKAQATMGANPVAAVKLLLMAQATEPKNPQIFLALGDVYSNENQSEEAIKAYESAVKFMPDKPEAFLALGTELLTGEKFELAEAFLMHGLLLSEPKETIDLYNLALAFYQQERPAEAIPFCHQALENGKDHDSETLLGDCLYDLERYEEAADAYTRSLASEPESAYDAERLGFTLERLERYQESIDTLQQALTNGSDEPDIYASLSRCYDQVGQKELSEETAKKYYELSPTPTEEAAAE
ncbi:MAG TPA: tetratricopeptide repeat protein [Fimbriimonadaceae bacterium]|jgi:tetratricopeptide (TPR) repeat protein